MIVVFMFFIFITIALVLNNHLIFVLIILEVLGFFLVYFIAVKFNFCSHIDFFVLVIFSVLVIEGVMALCGLILLVSFRGRDYLVPRSVLKV